MVTAADTWAELTPAWQACLEQAWQSWVAGCAAVGSVVVDEDGAIVAAGRNRALEAKSVPHELAGTPLAHAETVTLSMLGWGDFTGHTLLTSFEPCVMCATTILLVGVGRVEYAAADPYFEGLDDWFGALPWAAERLPQRSMLAGPAGAFAHLLHLSWLAFWVPQGPVIDAHRRVSPLLLEAAREVAHADVLKAVADGGGTALDAMTAVWSHCTP